MDERTERTSAGCCFSSLDRRFLTFEEGREERMTKEETKSRVWINQRLHVGTPRSASLKCSCLRVSQSPLGMGNEKHL